MARTTLVLTFFNPWLDQLHAVTHQFHVELKVAGESTVVARADMREGKRLVVDLDESLFNGHTAVFHLQVTGRSLQSYGSLITLRKGQVNPHKVVLAYDSKFVGRIIADPGRLYPKFFRFLSKVYSWSRLTKYQQACFLNIAAKMSHFRLFGWPSIMFIRDVVELREDRMFLIASSKLYEMCQLLDDISPSLKSVSQALHSPPSGLEQVWTNDDMLSFKTYDSISSLQLSFFRLSTSRELLEHQEHLVDVDLDECFGAGHLLDVARHHLTGQKTDSIDIGQGLLLSQGIDIKYRLHVA